MILCTLLKAQFGPALTVSALVDHMNYAAPSVYEQLSIFEKLGYLGLTQSLAPDSKILVTDALRKAVEAASLVPVDVGDSSEEQEQPDLEKVYANQYAETLIQQRAVTFTTRSPSGTLRHWVSGNNSPFLVGCNSKNEPTYDTHSTEQCAIVIGRSLGLGMAVMVNANESGLVTRVEDAGHRWMRLRLDIHGTDNSSWYPIEENE